MPDSAIVLNSMWKCRKFSRHFCPISMWSPKKKVITPMEASFSPILCWSRKKIKIKKKKKSPSSEFCNFSSRFLRHTRARRREPQLSTVFGGKQQKCRNSQNFSVKMLEKISHFFALIGNTNQQAANNIVVHYGVTLHSQVGLLYHSSNH